MESILEFLKQNGFTVGGVFIVLFFLLTFLFAADKFVLVLSGLFKIVKSLFYSPLLYLKSAVLEIAEYGMNGEEKFIGSRQYLLNKLLLTLQSVFVLLAIGVLAAGFVSGWNQLMPSRENREALTRVQDELIKRKSELEQTETALRRLDSNKTTVGDSMMQTYRAEQTEKIRSATAENIDIENRLYNLSSNTQETLSQMKRYYSRFESGGDSAMFDQAVDYIRSYINHRVFVVRGSTELLMKYNDNWYASMLAKNHLQNVSENQPGSVTQPTYSSVKERNEYLQSIIPDQEKQLTELQEKAKYNVNAFLLQLLYTILGFIVFVWVGGLLIEVCSLAVDMAGNLQTIRQYFTKEWQ